MPFDVTSAPDSPGVYVMRNRGKEIIYVGKAKSLKKRVASYVPTRPHDPKTAALIGEAESIEFILTDNEVEALILEARLINEHKPRYNIDLKDSSSYPYIRVTLEEDFPRVFITRERKEKKSLYIGPFTDVKNARRAVRLAIDIFGLHICNNIPKRRCLKHDTEKCSAPCIGGITKEDYRKRVEAAIRFLRGNVGEVIGDLESKMRESAEKQNYEAARVYRDHINAVEALAVRQKIVAEREYDEDVIAYMRAGEKYFVQIFNVRRGVLLGKTRHEAKSADAPPKFLAEFIKQHYYNAPIPEMLVLIEKPDDAGVIEEYLSKISGKRVRISVPKAGTKRKLVELLLKNVAQDVGEKYDASLIQLKDILSLPTVPLIIECFDISNIQGMWLVGSMVRFREGAPEKSGYRRFRIRTVAGQDDFASMHEVVYRRFTGMIMEQMSLPDLVVIDGGILQLNAALSAMQKAGVNIPVIALAKREEEIYVPGKAIPIRLDKREPALKLLQRARDEAHRFAVGYHRVVRRKGVIGK